MVGEKTPPGPPLRGVDFRAPETTPPPPAPSVPPPGGVAKAEAIGEAKVTEGVLADSLLHEEEEREDVREGVALLYPDVASHPVRERIILTVVSF